MTSLFKFATVFMIVFNIAPTMAAEFLPTVPKGYKISVFGSATNARQMALSPKGYLYVGSMEANAVHVIRNGKTTQVLKDLTYPSGLVWHNGDLYVAEISKLSVVRGVDALVEQGKPLKLTAIKSDFPSDLSHGWKYLALDPAQKKLYVPVGAPCNICPAMAPYASLHRLDLDGKNFETVATGIRNTTGFTFHPKTGQLWFTEHGRDTMGDNLPPDEVNILTEGGHYGFPYVHAKSVRDPHFYMQMPKGLKTVAPVVEIPAHSAPIGIRFTHGTPFEKAYPGCFFISLHGSWNRSKKSGYQVAIGCPDKNNQVKTLKPFLTGFLQGKSDTTVGRPVDLIFDAKGALLISDDHAGKIWRVEKQ